MGGGVKDEFSAGTAKPWQGGPLPERLASALSPSSCDRRQSVTHVLNDLDMAAKSRKICFSIATPALSDSVHLILVLQFDQLLGPNKVQSHF